MYLSIGFSRRQHPFSDLLFPTSAVCHGGTFTWKDEYGFTCPDHAEATWVYPEGLIVCYSTNFGNSSGSVTKIYGDEGTLDLSNSLAPTYSAAGAIKPSKAPKADTPVEPVECPDHFLDWLQCLRTRKTTNAPIEAGYVDVWTDTEGASIYCYGSVLDNLTSDPTTIPPQ